MDFSAPTLEATRQRLLARFGPRAGPWWDRLPRVLTQLSGRWELAVGDAIGRGNTSLVVRCRLADGRPAILKLTPEAELARDEAAALRIWEDSRRVPLVWGLDEESGALLLEAIPSETPLSEGSRPVELEELADLIGALHRAPVIPGDVSSLAERVDFVFTHWAQSLSGRGEAVDRLERGHELARGLAAEGTERVLLHGDLHPGNVLDGGHSRGLVAIDPRPCAGDPAFDAVDWVFWTPDERSWESRSRALAQAMGVQHGRLWAWCAALAPVLAASRAAHGQSAEAAALLELAP